MTLTANDCPSCQQLQRELADAVQRAEQAEADLKIAEQHLAAGRVIQDGLRSDLAAARRERDALRARLERAEAALFDARIIVAAEIARATGSRGGWTVSPVQLAEAVAAALGAAREEKANG